MASLSSLSSVHSLYRSSVTPVSAQPKTPPKKVVADCLSRKDIEAPLGTSQTSGENGKGIRLNRLLWILTEIAPDPAHLLHLLQLQDECCHDPHFGSVYRILRDEETAVPPELQDKLSHSTLVDSLLYYAITPGDALRLCIHTGLPRRKLLRSVHGSAVGGHRGVPQTLGVLLQKYYWFRLHKTVHVYIAQCVRSVRTIT